LILATASALFSQPGVHAAPPANEVEARLNALHAATTDAEFEALYSAPIPRYDLNGNAISTSAFSLREIRSGSYIRRKQQARELRFPVSPNGRSSIQSNDRPEVLIGDDVVYDPKIASFDKPELMDSSLPESPWSDDYWAIYKGVLGNRYQDDQLQALGEDWSKRQTYVSTSEKSPDTLLKAALSSVPAASSLSDLSPSEKYDILVGDANFTLTKKMWAEGKTYASSNNGKVETWMGICHGWAPASYMLPRPQGKITVLAADGRTKLDFYPSDIKGLASLLWAKSAPFDAQRFIGGRCNQKDPAFTTVGSRERVSDQSCFDNNPGTWHLAVTHLIGKAKRSFVMDATYDYEVWNQPVYGYSYSYFNPLTNRTVKTLKAATVELATLGKKDLFAKTRSKEAKSIVGIAMQVAYVAETNPSHAETDSGVDDRIMTVDYIYDLELDAAGNIIGGEWYQRSHPDFLWTFTPGARATAPADTMVKASDWQPGKALPADWSPLARRTSGGGYPLASVVEALITESNLTRR
jgi:hypothetical protein